MNNYNYLFSKGCHPSGMDLKYICYCYTHFYVIRGVKALQTNRAATFKCSGGTPTPCEAEPASPWHPFRALARWHSQLQLP